MENELYHYGIKRKSGRYPWGSGESPYQHESWFHLQVKKLKDEGMSEVDIANMFGMSTKSLRERYSISKDELRAARSAEALRLKDKGYSNAKIGELLGPPGQPLGESTVRNLLDPVLSQRANVTKEVSDILRNAVDSSRFIDVGRGVDANLGVSATKLNTAVRLLQDEGYVVYPLKVEQLGTGHKTELKVLCPPGTEYMDLVRNRDQITLPFGHHYDATKGGMSRLQPPVVVDPKRVAVRYAEDGGKDMDGVILIRRGVDDISLGEARYAQVRIKVGEDHYLKGMAMYSDDLPKGVDLLFNTNKTKDVPMLGPKDNTVLKNLKADPDNPFGATVDQRWYTDKNGVEKLSAINIVNEEGTWSEWSKSLSSQFLSKQNISLAKKQLGIDYQERADEFKEISELTNPAVKQKLLKSFADSCDAAAAHLKAAAMPRQASHVILPFPGIKENEIYAPNYENGETVVLVRHPHGGTFEIPTLTVNNKFKPARDTIGVDAPDAVGIHPKVAERLSGADFDGDTVLVIPNNQGAVKTSSALKGLENFDPKEYYKAYEGMQPSDAKHGFNTQTEMGKISNLITDMTIKGATQAELAAAVRHSMVVIDAEKHNLNWRQSYQDNNIASLKEKYQGGANRGASTLISRAGRDVRVPQRSQRTGIDPETGEKIFYETGETWTNKKGQIKERQTKVAEVSLYADANVLSSGTPMEKVYANYANQCKALANQARKELISTPSLKYSPSAAKTYATEVDSLNAKLNTALKNAPLERQAQLKANIVVAAKKKDNPEIANDKEHLSRLKAQELARARAQNGAAKQRVQITPKEWEAIQAGAISHSKLVQILENTDTDVVKAYATPRQSSGLTSAQISRIKSMIGSGKTQAEVAKSLGVSTSTIRKALDS